jgi:hypothetical protein
MAASSIKCCSDGAVARGVGVGDHQGSSDAPEPVCGVQDVVSAADLVVTPTGAAMTGICLIRKALFLVRGGGDTMLAVVDGSRLVCACWVAVLLVAPAMTEQRKVWVATYARP